MRLLEYETFNIQCYLRQDNTLKKGMIIYNTLTGGVIALDKTRIFLSVS